MVVKIPSKIELYIKNIKNVPLIEIQGTKWYIVTENEYKILKQYLKEIDSIPEKEWRTFPEKEIDLNCTYGNNAYNIIRNCVIKTEDEQGYRHQTRKDWE